VDKGSIDKGSVDKGSLDKKSGSVDKGKGRKLKATAQQREQRTVIIVAAVVVLGVAIGVYAYFASPRTGPMDERLNAPPDQMARFVSTDRYDKLGFERQRLYLKKLADDKKALTEQFHAGKFTKAQFEQILAAVWLGKQFDRVDKYYSLADIDKRAYLDKLIDKDVIDENDSTPKAADAPQRNKEKVKAVVEKMPEVDRRAYEAFRSALKEREKEREKEAKALARAAKAAATRPAERPTDRAPGVGGGDGATKPVTPPGGTAPQAKP
jgi:hypothetical protein